MSSKFSHWHVHPIRARYAETDQMGVVFHANYVTWFEIGRTELIRCAGYPYKAVEAAGLLLPVIELDCKFHAPARYDDEIVLCTRIQDISPLRLTFVSQIRKGVPVAARSGWLEEKELPGTLLVSGGTRHVWVDSSFQPTRLDRQLPELYVFLKRLLEGNFTGEGLS